jgi:hypothetical protein
LAEIPRKERRLVNGDLDKVSVPNVSVQKAASVDGEFRTVSMHLQFLRGKEGESVLHAPGA